MLHRTLAFTLCALALPAQSRLFRFPDLHGDEVVFCYGSDLWKASIWGGLRQKLVSLVVISLKSWVISARPWPPCRRPR